MEEDGRLTYLEALDYQCILVVKTGCYLFALDRAYVLFDFASDNHYLPFRAIFTDTAEPRAAITSCL